MSQCLLLKAFILGKDQDEVEKGWVYLVELLTINLGWYNIMLGSVRSVLREIPGRPAKE
jgi:hypothetical protein